MNDNLVNGSPVLIKHVNKWGGDYYLTDSLKFTNDPLSASIFRITTDDQSLILNNDLVHILSDNDILYIDQHGKLDIYVKDVDHVTPTFTITNGTYDVVPIEMESEV